MDEREERVRQRAHELWEADGRPDGRQEEHWRRASEEVDAGHGAEGSDEAEAANEQAAARAWGSQPQGGQQQSGQQQAGQAEARGATDGSADLQNVGRGGGLQQDAGTTPGQGARDNSPGGRSASSRVTDALRRE